MDDFLTDLDLISDILADGEYIDSLLEEIDSFLDKKGASDKVAFPLDKEILDILRKLKDKLSTSANKDIPYAEIETLNHFWEKVLSKSIQCLRLFDSREPFQNNPEKTIVAYGMDGLVSYYHSYAKFEGLLYGANANYRDHIFHIMRTWLIGLYVIIKKKFDIKDIDGLAEGWDKFGGGLKKCEKISMWTIIAFCHDLGYPLEKSKDILKETQKMLKEIVSEPKIIADFSFNGTQMSLNEYIVKFISTKMKKRGAGDDYLGRIQPKYYFKLSKSLEDFNHGIISAIVIYKILLYFLESDFNLNDDYSYKADDARQFYIRREILRAIAAHTCPDIYNIKVSTFSSLLYICDEMQNWGRKNWHDLYTASETKKCGVKIEEFSDTKICYVESITVNDKADICAMVYEIFNKQYSKFKKKFRDGQDSSSRKFDIVAKINITQDVVSVSKPHITITMSILGNDKSDQFEVECENCTLENSYEKIKNSIFINEFVEKKDVKK